MGLSRGGSGVGYGDGFRDGFDALDDAVVVAAGANSIAEFGEEFIRMPTLDAAVIRKLAVAVGRVGTAGFAF